MSNSTSVEKQLEAMLEEFKMTYLRPQIEKGLDAAAEVMKKNLENAIGKGDSKPHFSESWFVKKNYKGVRYVKNSKKVEGTGRDGSSKAVPLAAYLEHAVSSPHKGFIKRTVRSSREQVINAFKQAFK